MKPERFQEIVKSRLDKCRETEQIKGAEYSRSGDRLHNFKRAAAMDGTTPSRSLWGMWKKQLVSIIDMVDDLDNGIVPSQKMIDEKCGDNIVYTLLFEGLVEELREVNGKRDPFCVSLDLSCQCSSNLAAMIAERKGALPWVNA